MEKRLIEPVVKKHRGAAQPDRFEARPGGGAEFAAALRQWNKASDLFRPE